jgi:acyl-CoA thioesterase FadM
LTESEKGVYIAEWLVRYSEIDQIQHVRHDRYLDYCEDSRYRAMTENHFKDTISSDKFASLKVNKIYLDHAGNL